MLMFVSLSRFDFSLLRRFVMYENFHACHGSHFEASRYEAENKTACIWKLNDCFECRAMQNMPFEGLNCVVMMIDTL
jgi:hypothetical protein